MSKRSLNIEEPGSAPADAPAEAPGAIEEVETAELPLELVSPIVTVSPPLIEASTSHLPDAADVDPTKISTNTLTKQGWVLPMAATARAAE